MQKQTLNVEGMTCDHCKSAVEGALKDLNGVKDVTVDLDTGKVEVTYNDNATITETDMREAVEEQGYDVVA